MRLFLFFMLRRAMRRLCAQPREGLTPAAQWVRDHQHALYLLPRMPLAPLAAARFGRSARLLR